MSVTHFDDGERLGLLIASSGFGADCGWAWTQQPVAAGAEQGQPGVGTSIGVGVRNQSSPRSHTYKVVPVLGSDRDSVATVRALASAREGGDQCCGASFLGPSARHLSCKMRRAPFRTTRPTIVPIKRSGYLEPVTATSAPAAITPVFAITSLAEKM